MIRFYIPLILFSFMVLEGVSLKLLPNRLVHADFILIPHWVFIFLICVVIFFEREEEYASIYYAVIFGLMIDIVYTDILGVYMFTYAITIYMIKGISRLLQDNLLSAIIFSVVGIVMMEVIIQLIYIVIGVIQIQWKDYVSLRLLPTIMANIVFLLIIYPFVAKWLSNWKVRIEKETVS
ncbi:MAG TPA: rod shape-determining protein MreD [Cerasibacillus sp.]|uniref:rod shape-determining protein MreD n=1 Tax=Cerasibacillus sp. TaxID=2498711 RepID=UPI002F3F817D